MASRTHQYCCLALAWLLCPAPAAGDIILVSITGFVSASIDPGPPLTQSGLLPIGSISQTMIGSGNNFTRSNESHSWTSSGPTSFTLGGSGSITQAKTAQAGPGGIHRGISSLTVVFTTTTDTGWSMAGTYGFTQNSNGLPDSASWTLVGPGTNQGQTADYSGGPNQPFFGSQQLGVGTYTFTIAADLNERVNNTQVRSAGWNMSSFSLQSMSAVPESASLPILIAIVVLGAALACRRLETVR